MAQLAPPDQNDRSRRQPEESPSGCLRIVKAAPLSADKNPILLSFRFTSRPGTTCAKQPIRAAAQNYILPVVVAVAFFLPTGDVLARW